MNNKLKWNMYAWFLIVHIDAFIYKDGYLSHRGLTYLYLPQKWASNILSTFLNRNIYFLGYTLSNKIRGTPTRFFYKNGDFFARGSIFLTFSWKWASNILSIFLLHSYSCIQYQFLGTNHRGTSATKIKGATFIWRTWYFRS